MPSSQTPPFRHGAPWKKKTLKKSLLKLGELKAWTHFAFVYVDLAVSARESRQAGACVVVDPVDAGGVVQTGVRLALVNVDLAVHAWGNLRRITTLSPPSTTYLGN